MPADLRRRLVPAPINEKMRRGVYYPGHHLGTREELEQLVAEGLLERMDASFLCGPDSEPTYCLAEPKRAKTSRLPIDETER